MIAKLRMFCLHVFVSSILVATASLASAADLTIYADSLASGWADWSWGTTRNLAATAPVQGGARSIAVTFTSGWAGLYLHADQAIDLSGYDKLRFWIHGGTAGNQQLRIVANGNSGQPIP